MGTARGRILAEPVAADRDYPAIDRSLRDGFAVRREDVPGFFNVHGELRAGELTGEWPLTAGNAIEIMTGAPYQAALMGSAGGARRADRIGRRQPDSCGREVGARAMDQPAQLGSTDGNGPDPCGGALDSSHIALWLWLVTPASRLHEDRRWRSWQQVTSWWASEKEPAPHQIRNSNSYAWRP